MEKNIQIESIVEMMIQYQDMIGQLSEEMKELIDQFRQMSYDFLTQLTNVKNREHVLKVVKEYVLLLNHVNDAAGGELIETDEREDICSFIMEEVESVGFDFNYDITEEYREW